MAYLTTSDQTRRVLCVFEYLFLPRCWGDDWDPDGYELWRNSVGAWQSFAETDPNWSWTDGLRHLVECIQSGARPMITPEHGFHALEIMIKAQESGRDGQARPVESTFTPPTFFEEGE